jgi:hypothetical protein
MSVIVWDEDEQPTAPADPPELAALLVGKSPKDAARVREAWAKAQAIKEAGGKVTSEDRDEEDWAVIGGSDDDEEEEVATSLADVLREITGHATAKSLTPDERSRLSHTTIEAAEVAARRNPLGVSSSSLWDEDE